MTLGRLRDQIFQPHTVTVTIMFRNALMKKIQHVAHLHSRYHENRSIIDDQVSSKKAGRHFLKMLIIKIDFDPNFDDVTKK